MVTVSIVEGVALVLLGVLLVGLLRSHADLVRRLHDLEGDLEGDVLIDLTQQPATGRGVTGQPAHDLSGYTLDGEAVEIGLVGVRGDAVLAFLSASFTCEPFWATLAAGVDVPGGARIIVVVQESDSLPRLRRLAGERLLVVRSDDAWQDYRVPGSPHFAYVTGLTGRVAGEGTASTWAGIGDLLERAAGDRLRAPVSVVTS